MNHRTRFKLPLFSLAGLVMAAHAMAQRAPADAPASAPASERQKPGEPGKLVNNSTAARVGMSMGRAGGSLLKASLAAAPDPGQAKLAQVSFFAVPEREAKVLKKHDLVEVIIKEESEATSKAQNDLKKTAELQAQVNQMVKLKLAKGEILGLPTPTSPPGIDFTGSRTFHGQGEMDRSDSLTARITAEVVDVKPNGTLVLQARKRIKTDDEDQVFILTGTCRAEDVTPDNTLLSTQLYDLELQKNSKGDVRSSTERGRLPKLLDFLNIF